MSTDPNVFAAEAGSAGSQYLVYIGTYGKGVHAFRFDPAEMRFESLGLVGEVVNPSWITADRSFKNLYAVSELDGTETGGVASFTIDRKSGRLAPLNHLPSGGVAPCYASVDATGKMLVVANYMTGGVSAFPLQQDGSLGAMGSLMKAEGSSVNKDRQEGPHAHEAVITSDNRRVYVPDLGLDQIRIYKLELASGKLVPNQPPFSKVQPGHGPRHIVFDGSAKHAYVINELKPLVSVYAHDSATGNLTLIEELPTIPADFTKETTGAEIRLAPSGRFLYTSNRGNDSIQVYSVNPESGKLKQIQNIPTEGEGPRGFALDPTGRFLLAGNQQSNTLVLFKVDEQTGNLTSVGKKLEVPSPVDVLFVPAA